jgi:hypothetical protein
MGSRSAGAREHASGAHVLGVELADNAIHLADLPMARQPTIAVLGHESDGIPPEALDLLDTVVEIPESAIDLYALDLAAQLKLDVKGPLNWETGLAVTRLVRKDFIELTDP